MTSDKHRGEEHEAQHRIEVGVEHALHRVLAGPAPAEHDLDQHGAADQKAVEHADDGHDRRQRVARTPWRSTTRRGKPHISA